MSQYNFDDADEYVEFVLFGNVYQFWYPTTEEALEVQKLGDEQDKVSDLIFSKIKRPEGADYPEFSEVKSKMNVKQVSKFREMLNTELGIAD